MLGDSSSSLLAADSGGDGAGVDGHDGGAVERDGGERGMFGGGGGGNRWPRQETLALLQIRSEMDLQFRDSSAKGPLWEEISRKLADLGYHRSAKKCKEKFENVYKYHKRTRETRTGKQDGKNYRFFDQLEAFDSSHSPAAAATTPPQPPPQPPRSATIMPSVAPPITTPNPVHHIVTSTNTFLSIPSLPMQNPTTFPQTTTANPNIPTNPSKNPFSNVNSTSSSTFSDDGLRSGGGGNKKKRKWKEFFERLMKDVMDKQDELQSKFLEAIERRERERTAREDSWRLQEMARINKERELLAQERSMAAAKDTAVMAFLQKLAEQQNLGQQVKVVGNNLNFPPPSQPPPAPPPVPPQPPQLPQPPKPPPSTVVLPPLPPQPQSNTANALIVRKTDNGDNFASPSSSRWPKVEIEALIQLRTNLDSKYLENGPKGPLWEEISAAMKRLGYDRSSKRCKEKWENINKYFKKVKESNKKRRDDAKTCPYFKQLDAIYSDRSSNKNMMDMAPLMVTPEQQWHPQQDQAPRNHHHDVAMDDVESDHIDDEDGDDDEDNGGEYEVVANAKPSSNGATATI